MQVIYVTPRLENAERVSTLLSDAGIGNRVLYGPHHRRPSWRAPNYRQAADPGNWPRVLVLSNGDLPQARQILRDAGLLAPPAYERDGDPPAPRHHTAAVPPADAVRRSWLTPGRIRTVLIITVLVLALLQFGRGPG